MPKTQSGDRILYLLDGTPVMQKVDSPRGSAERANFLIVCDYGDWSGFRTLAECTAQFPTIEGIARKYDRPIGFYAVVER